MNFHPGHIESKHKPKSSDWFKDSDNGDYSAEFCDNLSKGGFIPCGNSGLRVFQFVNGNIEVGDEVPGCATCCFCFGNVCSGDTIERRWSCCGQSTVCTFEQMLSIEGCRFATVPNVTSLKKPCKEV